MDRQNEGIEDAARLRLILLDMGGLLPQSEGKQDWPSYSYKTFPLAYLPDPRIAQIQADLTLQDVHKLYLLSKNQIEFVSRILVITGILGHFQQKTFGEVYYMQSTIDNLQILWDFLVKNDHLVQSDIIIGFGSNDIMVANCAADLYKRNYAPLVLFTGGLGKGTADSWEETEADRFAKFAIDNGVPPERVIIENKSTNTGENIRFSKELLQNKGIKVELATIVHQPNMGRRIYAALRKQWEEINVQIAPRNCTLQEYIQELKSTGVDENEIFSNIVGDFQRIDVFAKKGYQIEQFIPEKAWRAYYALCDSGYTKYII